MTGSAPGSPVTRRTLAASASGASQPWYASGSAMVALKADAAQAGAQRGKSAHREVEDVAALGRGKGVDLVDDDRLEAPEHPRRVGVADQQRQRFGCRQKDLRRAFALAGLAVGRRVAGSRLDPDVESHLGDRVDQVARDVDGQRFQRADIDRVEPVGRRSRSVRRGSAESRRGSCPSRSARRAARDRHFGRP